ncbi:MAG: transcriptional regulator, GntR family [Nocardioidaceae bacterium]|nr:transcriptional regulator, GntR family [Nocardioidaceae bacterium]
MLPVQLDRTAPGPLGTQLAGRIRNLLSSGGLPRGARLPSSRALAADLGVSRSVTEHAYEQLLAEGWVETRHGAGTYVASGGHAAVAAVPVRRTVTPPELVPLDAGTPWIDPRHAAGWRRAWREVSSARPPRGYDDPRGLPDLRAALAERLSRTRGVLVEPDEVLVTAGSTDGLRHVVGALPPGPIGVEDPGYRAAVETVRSLGREVRSLPATGPVTSMAGLVAGYVTPAHQHPLGRVMPAEDRLGLLAAAQAADALVVEDDYDSEFRWDVAPVPALASLDRSRVVYLGTAAKAVAPSLRLGWLVAPEALREAVNRRREITHDAAPWPVQRAFLALLRDGYVDRVVRSARRVYAARAPRVAAVMAPYAEATGPDAGMYSTWLLPPGVALRVRDAAAAAGFGVNLLDDYCRGTALTGVVLGFGGVTDAELDRALAVIDRTLAD